jgi:uncharacterized protein YceH (UPF0502 family)
MGANEGKKAPKDELEQRLEKVEAQVKQLHELLDSHGIRHAAADSKSAKR